MLTKAQSHRELFIAQIRMVGREIRRKIAFVVAGPAVNRTFEQPFPDTILGTTAHLADFVQQRRHMDGIPKPSGQRRIADVLNFFHTATVTWWA